MRTYLQPPGQVRADAARGGRWEAALPPPEGSPKVRGETSRPHYSPPGYFNPRGGCSSMKNTKGCGKVRCSVRCEQWSGPPVDVCVREIEVVKCASSTTPECFTTPQWTPGYFGG